MDDLQFYFLGTHTLKIYLYTCSVLHREKVSEKRRHRSDAAVHWASAACWFETVQQARRREETIKHMIWSNIAIHLTASFA